jgi:hypothetical protein
MDNQAPAPTEQLSAATVSNVPPVMYLHRPTGKPCDRPIDLIGDVKNQIFIAITTKVSFPEGSLTPLIHSTVVSTASSIFSLSKEVDFTPVDVSPAGISILIGSKKKTGEWQETEVAYEGELAADIGKVVDEATVFHASRNMSTDMLVALNDSGFFTLLETLKVIDPTVAARLNARIARYNATVEALGNAGGANTQRLIDEADTDLAIGQGDGAQHQQPTSRVLPDLQQLRAEYEKAKALIVASVDNFCQIDLAFDYMVYPHWHDFLSTYFDKAIMSPEESTHAMGENFALFINETFVPLS